MSKYSDDLVMNLQTTGRAKQLTEEIKDAMDKKRVQKECDANITGVLKGKFKRIGY